jgi:deferrochelatase/peroxidase EfeB
VRRIDIAIDRWDGETLQEQERIVGRFKASGGPLSGGTERDALDLLATGPDGSLAIASNAHVRLASAATNMGRRILRRPYSFVDRDGGHGNISAGLFFAAFLRDPGTQFVPLQRRLAETDALSEYIRHTGSAIFAVLPGVEPGAALGADLFGS